MKNSPRNILANKPFEDDFGQTLIQTKLTEIESRLCNLEMEQNLHTFQAISSFPNYQNQTSFTIVDCSPEWDYTKGGSKVLICVSPLCYVTDQLNEKLRIKFGEVPVSGYFIQPGVIKCFGNSLHH